MTTTEFAAAVVVLIDDNGAYRRASNRDLMVIFGVLSAIVASVESELKRRKKR